MKLFEVDEFESSKYEGPQEKLEAAERRMSLVQRRMELAQETIDSFRHRFKRYSYDPVPHPHEVAAGYMFIPHENARGNAQRVYDMSGTSTIEKQRLLRASEVIRGLHPVVQKIKQQIQRYRTEAKKAEGTYISRKDMYGFAEKLQKELGKVVLSLAGSDWQIDNAGSYTHIDNSGNTRVLVGFSKVDNAKNVHKAVHDTFVSGKVKKIKDALKTWLALHDFVKNRVAWTTANTVDYSVKPPAPQYNLQGWFDVRVDTDKVIARYK